MAPLLTEETVEEEEPRPQPLWALGSMRLKIAILITLALYASTSMRSSLSIGIVCMVNGTVSLDDENLHLKPKGNDANRERIDACPAHIDKNASDGVEYSGKLSWPPGRQTMLFSASYYGSLLTMLISGTMADKYGPKRILMGAMALQILITLAGPTLAKLDYWVFYGSRVLLGMCEGFITPCANSLGGRWFPSNEKSAMAALYTSGNQIAAGSSGFVGAWLCKVPILDGWPAIFYLFGAIGILCLILWACAVSDHPSDNGWIRVEEREYLRDTSLNRSTGESVRRMNRVINQLLSKMKGALPCGTYLMATVSVPWSKILRSQEVHVCLFCHFTFAFLASINQNFLPLYFKEELALPLSMNGLYTTFPFVTQLIMKNALAACADHLKSTGRMTPTNVTKMFQSIASFGTATTLVCLAIFPSCHRPWLAGVLMLLYGCFFSAAISGFFTALLSIAPAYIGTLSSISSAFGVLAAVLSTNTVAAITYQGWPHKWLIIFLMGAALQIISGLFFLIFGSGEPADWGAIDHTNLRSSLHEDVLLNDHTTVNKKERDSEILLT